MSGLIKGARRGPMYGARGDPGLFSAIGGALKGAVTGFVSGGFNPVSAITGGIRGLVGGGGAGAAPPMLGTALPPPSSFAGPGPVMRSPQQVSDIQRVRGVFGDVATFDMTPGMGGVATETKAVAGCPSGYHPNKSGYYRRLPNGGAVVYIPKGHVCVKNRRRNSLNPRALDRAISRVEGAKRVQAKLSEITTKRYTASGKRKDR